MFETLKRIVVLNDGKVLLRPYEKKDIAELHQAVRESIAEISPWIAFAHKDYSIKETKQWIKQRPEEWRNGISYDFAIFSAADGAYLGGIGIGQINYNSRYANLGYWVRTSRTGKGVAPAATHLLANWGFKELDLHRIEIVIATGNTRSQRVAEKAGAQREGILRNRIIVLDKTYDAVMFSLIPQDFGLK
jgi:ribosomal-protein-serine acetyltransferase